MKDKFFRFLDEVRVWIYCTVLRVTYLILMRKKARNLNAISTDEKRSIRNFWNKYGVKFYSFDDYRWYKSRGAKIDPKMIPETVYHAVIEPHFTNLRMLDGFQDKNYFDFIIGKDNSPETICHCINGRLLDSNYNYISIADLVSALSAGEQEYICKPSQDSCGGRGIRFIKSSQIDESFLTKLKEEYGNNFLIQKVIKQCKDIAKYNNSSLNTIRICTFLFRGNVRVLSCFLRVGKAGSRVDNLSSGGYCLKIGDKGEVSGNPIGYDGNKIEDINVDCTGQIPQWGKVIEVVKKMHYKLAHFQLINWDVAINDVGQIIIVEYNLIDTSVLRHQLNNGPIFGEMTEEVLDDCFRKCK